QQTHQRVAPQPAAALRDALSKPVHGVTTRALSRDRKPPERLGAGTSTPRVGRPHGQHAGSTGSKESMRSRMGGAGYVVCIGAAYRAPPPGPDASRCCPTIARTGVGSGVAALSLYAAPQAGADCGSCNITTAHHGVVVEGISRRHCHLLDHSDRYGYSSGTGASPHRETATR